MDDVATPPRSGSAETVESGVLAALTGLMSRWSSSDVQSRIAQGVGVALDASEVRAIYVLGMRGGAARPSELAHQLHLTRPTASKLIARLAADGLVEKTVDPSDGRAAVVRLTESGEHTLTRLRSAGDGLIAHATQGWTAEESSALADLLGRFVDGLMRATPTPPDEPVAARASSTEPEPN
ncbi:MarR family winged helix-turn-helix transcriptional regulator [Salinibacterium hongtaonis]|uniref:MarR family winged helix-turn-helix transcriptional regulator n=1 Tax=Homoserinimonas hongtaonis TaxID=2079791 RepID=UPI000D332333|nr:MarR family transcriptional regulator [Salinibacterium hongtaonis]AWB89036.1 MarR family transcriptional regulator [Salinibacterium hongtaonis]